MSEDALASFCALAADDAALFAALERCADDAALAARVVELAAMRGLAIDAGEVLAALVRRRRAWTERWLA